MRYIIFLASLLCLGFSAWLTAAPSDAIATRVSPALMPVYEARAYAPLWLDAQNRPSTRADEALSILRAAPDDGLSSTHYHLSKLEFLRDTLLAPADDTTLAQFDLELSEALLTFVLDLSTGQINPRKLGLTFETQTRRQQMQDNIGLLLNAASPASVIDSLRPQRQAYNTLRAALPAYRQLAAAHPDSPALPPLPGNKLEPGTEWAGCDLLAEWLILLGDLPSGKWTPGTGRYEQVLVDGVKQFQTRHGLSVDGVIGKQTDQALRTPLPIRVQQIELAMERLRWIEYPGEQRYVMVNIPQFQLIAYDPTNISDPLIIDIVVGKAGKHQTPQMSKTISHVIFSPYWNVPRSIATKEIVPKWREEPNYLASQNMELVDSDGDVYRGDQDVDAPSDVMLGDYRIRQRPGTKNALGGIKFMFPNNDSIYMHDTPQQSLFKKDRRDFSHGCIRLANPIEMGIYALSQESEAWPEEKILTQIATGKEKHLALSSPIPVYLMYLTAAKYDETHLSFLTDIYGEDGKLATALAAQQ